MSDLSLDQALAVAVDSGRPALEREQAIHQLGASPTPDVIDHLIKLLEDNARIEDVQPVTPLPAEAPAAPPG